MSADKLGRFMASPEFLARANAAIARSVRELKMKGIQPVYSDRNAGRIVGADASRTNGSCDGRCVTDILKREANPMGGGE
ncbi:hypothetical protein KDX05_16055 [Burkholderia vietnamiensis]|uniref:hypothetical protein n=1 Tax=Burkholderia vietnamiensis TaxID=60552 RepID=UPI001BA190F7|nr:hypothetical protein [Burkholderia vietnamiensis]MBR8229827.1 hypothetical protein [Burkholderia vietnamiensis]